MDGPTLRPSSGFDQVFFVKSCVHRRTEMARIAHPDTHPRRVRELAWDDALDESAEVGPGDTATGCQPPACTSAISRASPGRYNSGVTRWPPSPTSTSPVGRGTGVRTRDRRAPEWLGRTSGFLQRKAVHFYWAHLAVDWRGFGPGVPLARAALPPCPEGRLNAARPR